MRAYRLHESRNRLEQRLGCVYADYDQYLAETPVEDRDSKMVYAFEEAIADYERRIRFA